MYLFRKFDHRLFVVVPLLFQLVGGRIFTTAQLQGYLKTTACEIERRCYVKEGPYEKKLLYKYLNVLQIFERSKGQNPNSGV